MKKAFVAARHGSYDSRENLDPYGKEQMKLLAEAVRNFINGHELNITLLCSTAPRAEQGGRILVETLGVPEEQVFFHEALWVDNYHAGDWSATKGLVEKGLQDGSLVLVLSHLDVVPQVTRFVAGEFGVEGQVHEVYYGEGFTVSHEGISLIPKI